MEINELIRQRREELNLTLEQVADKVGVGKSTVRKWETGYIKNMKRDKIAKLADALKISPATLMGLDNEIETTNSALSPFGADEEILQALKDDPELLKTFNHVRNSDNLRILFDSTEGLTIEDLKPVLMLINGIRKDKGLD